MRWERKHRHRFWCIDGTDVESGLLPESPNDQADSARPDISVRGKWYYLYRAVDKHGKTVDFLLRPDRGIAAAQAFFRKALATSLPRWPRKVTLNGHVPSHRALRLLRREDPKWKYVVVGSCRYLNNIVEQDHRAIKRRCAWMTGFKSFRNAAMCSHHARRNRAGESNSKTAVFIRPRPSAAGMVIEATMGPGLGLESR